LTTVPSSGTTKRFVSRRANGPAERRTNGPWPRPAQMGCLRPRASGTRHARPTSRLRWCPGQDLWDRGGWRRCDRRAIRATCGRTLTGCAEDAPLWRLITYRIRNRAWRRRQPRRSRPWPHNRQPTERSSYVEFSCWGHGGWSALRGGHRSWASWCLSRLVRPWVVRLGCSAASGVG
jgi:hypothetical protein